MKRLIYGIIAALLCIAMCPVSAFAADHTHTWVDNYYESNDDGSTHKHYFYCSECYETKYEIEPCTWEGTSDYDYLTYGGEGHRRRYDCKYCYGSKYENENCSWQYMSTYYDTWNGSQHQKVDTYNCNLCYNYKKVTTNEKHSVSWVRSGSNFYYECTKCYYAPKFNGNILYDGNDAENITIRRKGKYILNLINYNKKYNPVKSIKYSKKKICKVKKNGKKLTVKGLKKGKCKITINMKSGAQYTVNVKVK